ncbi:MAG: SDR family NAD(P)-dependent oxidoreductase [Rhizobiaceae bacterium]
MSTFADHHVVVSGGGTGVGAAIASAFAKAGARVTILGRRQSSLDAVAKTSGALALACDVTNRETVDRALDKARAVNGATSIAIANAGAASSAPFAKMKPSDLNAMLDVNLNGVFNLWQACLPDLKSRASGRLIAIASTAGLKGYAYVSGYCAAKHGVIGLTRAVALELADSGITANAICPGFVDTPLLNRSVENIVSKTGLSDAEARQSLVQNNPQGRFIEVDEVADTALWLAGDGARSVNGQAISVNGGEV